LQKLQWAIIESILQFHGTCHVYISAGFELAVAMAGQQLRLQGEWKTVGKGLHKTSLWCYGSLLLLYLCLLPFLASGGEIDSKEKPCADFNIGASVGAMAGLESSFVCPLDGVSRTSCREPFPVKDFKDIHAETVNLADVLFYVLVGPKSKTDAFKWWLPLLREPNVDILLVSDACEGAADSTSECEDGVTQLLTDLRSSVGKERQAVNSKLHSPTFHLARVNPWDKGYDVLSCKTRSGQREAYKRFPDKKFYFKFDTDTIIFPGRLQHFLQTLLAVHAGGQHPMYFGAVQERCVCVCVSLRLFLPHIHSH
jgi:hypothetical protein